MSDSLVVLQARLGSTRLPGKVMLPVDGIPMIELQINRILQANIGPLVVATTDRESDDSLVEYMHYLGVKVVRGSETDVVSRFKSVIEMFNPRYFVRLTADCPLVMPDLLVEMNDRFLREKVDYLSNTVVATYPDGLDAEFVKVSAFVEMSQLALSNAQREHVTLAIYQNSHLFQISHFTNEVDLSSKRWTVDYREDLEFVRDVYSFFKGRESTFTMLDVLRAIQSGAISDNSVSADLRNVALRNQIGEKNE
jgi:spore coat polysaccharide biosynthesis protein SpsF (cytidylyltransferase family)